jgi:hypothetical protein
MLAPVPSTISDDTEIDVACAYLASKLRTIDEVHSKCSKLSTDWRNKGVFCVGVLRARKFTALQINVMLEDAGLGEDMRTTIEYAFKITFDNPELPQGVHHRTVTSHSGLRPSAYLQGVDTLGHKLKKLDLLKDVRLSPRLDAVVSSRESPTRPDYDKAIAECVIFTLKTYSMVNVDTMYLDKIALMLSAFFNGKVPDGRKGYSESLLHKFNNAKKKGAAVGSANRRNSAHTACAQCCSRLCLSI